MSDNPTTSEWTVETVAQIQLKNTGVIGIGPNNQAIANAHNAALAAEKQKRADWNVVIEDLERELATWKQAAGVECERKEAWFKENQQLREQLAAEVEVGHNTAVALAQQITKLEDQLAAERKHLSEFRRQWDQHADELREQLEAEREKVKTLRDALVYATNELYVIGQPLADDKIILDALTKAKSTENVT